MGAKFGNRVKETTRSVGTGTLDLDGSVEGFRSFNQEFDDGATVYYLIVDPTASPYAYEFGEGTLTIGTPTTLSRDTVLGSSNNDNKVSFDDGIKTVVSGMPKEQVIEVGDAIAFTGANSMAGTTGLNGVTTHTKQFRTALGTTVASAATLAIPTDGNIVDVTGSVTVTAFSGLVAGTFFVIRSVDGFGITENGDDIIAFPWASTTYVMPAGACSLWYAHATNKARFLCGMPILASQADVEARSNSTRAVTPGRMQYHDGVAKFWCEGDADGSDLASHNVASITDNGSSDWTVTIDDDFSGSDWAVNGDIEVSAITVGLLVDTLSRAAGSINVRTVNDSGNGSETDLTAWSVVGFGDQ